MRDVDFMAAYEGVMKQIKEGAFLTVKAGEALNTMTIGGPRSASLGENPS